MEECKLNFMSESAITYRLDNELGFGSLMRFGSSHKETASGDCIATYRFDDYTGDEILELYYVNGKLFGVYDRAENTIFYLKRNENCFYEQSIFDFINSDAEQYVKFENEETLKSVVEEITNRYFKEAKK